jgi:type I restriction enzyme, R subunit
MDQDQDIFEKILENKSFGGIVENLPMKSVYTKLNENYPG